MNTPAPDLSKCARCAKVLIYLAIVEAVIFMVLKVVLGLSSGSRALVAASLYSFQDLIASVIAALGITASVRPPDADHPYGHGKVEYLMVALMSLLLLLGLLALMVTALSGVFGAAASGKAPGLATLWVAFLCGVVCWFLGRRAECVARRLNSPALSSCSQHLHSDVVASAAVIVSLIGAHLGLVVLDHVVAAAEAIHILYVSGRMLVTAVNGLMDSSVEPILLQRLTQAVAKMENIVRVRDLRARWAGQSLLAQVSVEVAGQMKVAEADDLRARIEQLIQSQADWNTKAIVRIVGVPELSTDSRLG